MGRGIRGGGPVNSKSTERHDRGDKFDGYKGIATLKEYVLVEYERRSVEVWRPDDGGAWTSRTYGPGGAVALANVDLALTLDQIFEDSGV